MQFSKQSTTTSVTFSVFPHKPIFQQNNRDKRVSMEHENSHRTSFTVKQLKKKHILIIEKPIICLNITKKPSKEELKT